MSTDLRNDPPTPETIAWCQLLHGALVDGGVWGIPRSGVIFHKRDDRLVLDEELLSDEPALRELQEADYEACREHFGAAGIEVTRSC